MKARWFVCFVLCVPAGCTSSVAPMGPAPAPELAAGPVGLELLEIHRVDRSPAEGTVVLRLANRAGGPVVVGVDVRAEPGMWLAPARQQTELFYLPPDGERSFSVEYSFARLSPEATLRVRVGAAEEHADGWVHVPEPIAVRHFDLGTSEAAAEFLDRFDSRAARHITIYALPGMLSPEQLDAIAAERDGAIAEVSRLLDVRPPPGLTLVLYPDAASKTADTQHIGAGMARGNTLAEIFNDSVRVDPFHEIAHAVSGQLGWAPAWLNEGFAVYASEYLGADALALQGSRGKTVDQAACELRRAGALFSVADLIHLPDIGSDESRPHVSYAQAASFTAFLAQRFGLQALRNAYATLSPVASSDENEAAFAEAFGVGTGEAARWWSARLEEICR
jgi:hypothetical protein